MKNHKSFTLLELLVVIAILAGFMALLVPNFMQVRIKSRDVRRKGDLKAIQKALEMYKQNQLTPAYPDSPLSTCSPLSDANGVYMQEIPPDPSSQCGSGMISYFYLKDVSDSSKYTLCACLENPNDTEQKAPVLCTGAPACTGKYYKLTEP